MGAASTISSTAKGAAATLGLAGLAQPEFAPILDATSAPPGAAATSTTRKLDLVARAEAADALRRTPGIMKLIEARIFKFDDFLTDGSLDATKLADVRRVLARRVDDTAESYALAASARGYAPSGAAYPIEGLWRYQSMQKCKRHQPHQIANVISI